MNFYDKVQRIVERIPRGRVATYGQIAALAGSPRAARQVGRFLYHRGPKGLPWQRIIASSGYLTIQHPLFSADMQKRLLEREGVAVSRNEDTGLYYVDIELYLWQPKSRF